MTVHTEAVPTQGVYRQLLQAMSHPGRLHTLPAHPWPDSRLAVCATLFDHEVSYCVTGPAAPAAWDKAIFAATKARRVPVAEADFIVLAGHESAGALTAAKRGTPAFPDQGATLLYCMAAPLEPGVEATPLLSGPGMARRSYPEVNPLTGAEWSCLRQVNSDYPLGVDVICLLGPDRVLCLPRSTHIEMGG